MRVKTLDIKLYRRNYYLNNRTRLNNYAKHYYRRRKQKLSNIYAPIQILYNPNGFLVNLSIW